MKEEKIQAFHAIEELYGTKVALEVVSHEIIKRKREEAEAKALSEAKKTKVEEFPPHEDYFKPDVKLTAMGVPVIKKGFKATNAKCKPAKFFDKIIPMDGMKPLSEYWSKERAKGKEICVILKVS